MKYRAPLLPISVFILFIATLPVAVVLADELDYDVCVERLEQELHTFQSVVYFSLALTFVNFIISLLVLAKRFVRNPKCGYRYYFGIASIKLFLSIALLTFLWPSCPYGCGDFCQVGNHVYLYPIIVLAISINWMFRGYQFYKIHQAHQAAREASASASSIGENGEEEGEEATVLAMTSDPHGKLSKGSTTKNEGIV